MSIIPELDLVNATAERLNDVTFFLHQLANHYVSTHPDLKASDVVKARCVGHKQYLLEFGRLSEHALNWNAHSHGTFDREVIYVRNDEGEMQQTSLYTHRRLIRLSRESHGTSPWIVTLLQGHDFDGRNVDITGLVGAFMERHHEADMEYRRKNPDYRLPGKIGQICRTAEVLAEELDVSLSSMSWTQAVELLHRLQRQYGMWESMKDNALCFNIYRSVVEYAGSN